MTCAARVNDGSRDGPGRVDGWSARETVWPNGGALQKACASVRGIKRGDGAVASPQEAMFHKVPVKVGPRNHPRRVDVHAVEDIDARYIERGEGPALCDEGSGFDRGVRARASVLCVRLQAS